MESSRQFDLKAALDARASGDADRMLSFFSNPALVHFNGIGEHGLSLEITGGGNQDEPTSPRALIRTFFSTWRWMRYSILNSQVGDDDGFAIVEIDLECVPTGARRVFVVSMYFELDNGLISSMTEFFDTAGAEEMMETRHKTSRAAE